MIWLTQVARALGLQEAFATAHAVLDDLTPGTPEAVVRTGLERGRVIRSSGRPDEARSFFEAAARTARAAGLDALAVDALHMVALVVQDEHRLDANHAALDLARSSTQPAARDWDASILNNIGMVHADAGNWDQALAAFEEALDARERIGDDRRTRVARWMVAWALRNLGRRAEALEIQQRLKAEHEALGTSDEYVDEEIALLAD
ncbi:tetratricopeptide repeat protein [Antribacter gilvus]|uniref:tetratricopeptide repeat protein n=1 Tax=Antribacter gilvus TaxID=2304675 RepID=UPI000F77D58D|nr:tetratricopeptide repeat protein [Antribacter gilvus]